MWAGGDRNGQAWTLNSRPLRDVLAPRAGMHAPARSRTMPDMFAMKPIGTVRSTLTDRAQIPTGKGARHEAEGVLEILPELEAGLTDLEGFSHLYVIWVFDRAEGYDLMTATPLDPRPHGVFSTRSPRRPNPIALTVVRLLRREGHRLHVRGLDMLDGTPILDVKPYLSNVPEGELERGWMTEVEKKASPRDTP